MTLDAAPTPSPAERESGQAFRHEVEELDLLVVQLGALVCETVPTATRVLLDRNVALAQTLAAGDPDIDDLTLRIEDRCLSVLARHAPRAGELRRVVTVMRLANELELAADLMVNVTKATRRMLGSPLSPQIRGLITDMGREANQLLRLSVDAYVDGNVGLARSLNDLDDRLDDMNGDMVRMIFEGHAQDRIDLPAAMQLALVARYYERVGDHAVNIGDRVVYMVTGWSPGRTGSLQERPSPDQRGRRTDPAGPTR